VVFLKLIVSFTIHIADFIFGEGSTSEHKTAQNINSQKKKQRRRHRFPSQIRLLLDTRTRKQRRRPKLRVFSHRQRLF
jgi:hypothetical protein